ncbi:uncharacterized protein LOC129944120 [Eupeodes corollae]|uniref:uncharacterized protein LOC129944120 n=1 Tax=Eupeodes corollae TaxID=290404 RepID=UPI0024935C55|nr:uncharacterized protein LOC129944120 [Eupeodes corollae]
MYQLVIAFITSLLLTVVASLPTNSNNLIDPEIPTDSEADNFLDIDKFANSTAFTVVENGTNLRYTFGKRVKSDRLVSQNTETNYWPTPQNVTLILQYPGSGQGAIITFVEVVVNQSSNIGLARVIAGGIGKRFMATIVEGNRTFWFNYSAHIYGI